jgi:hypothetical protein
VSYSWHDVPDAGVRRMFREPTFGALLDGQISTGKQCGGSIPAKRAGMYSARFDDMCECFRIDNATCDIKPS